MAGRVKETKGGIKEGAGKLLRNEDMQAEGRAEKTAGRTQRRAKGSVKEVTGAAKQATGKVTGNKSLEHKGKAEKKAGLIDER